MSPSVVAALGTLIVIAPALPSLIALQAGHAGPNPPVSGTTWIKAAHILYGFPDSDSGIGWVLVGVPVLLTLGGAYRFCRERPALAVPMALFLATPAIAYALSSFSKIDHAYVFLRYQTVSVPFLLFFLVLGFRHLRDLVRPLLPRASPFLVLAGFGLVVLLVVLGPLPRGLPPRHPFGPLFSPMHAYLPSRSEMAGRSPAFYRRLDRSTRPTVIECFLDSDAVPLAAGHHLVHGGRTIRAHLSGAPVPGLRFRAFLFGLQALDRATPADAYVVLHRHAEDEVLYLRTGRVRPSFLVTSRPWQRVTRECEARFGAPVYEDHWLVVFAKGQPAPLRPLPDDAPREALPDGVLALSLSGPESPVLVGSRFALEIRGGAPGRKVVLAITRVGEARWFRTVTRGTFDSTGAWRINARGPPRAAGRTITIQALGDLPSGPSGFSNRLTLSFAGDQQD